MKWNERIYALYKGEKLIADGTIPEISERMNWKVDSIKFLTYPSYKNRVKGPNSLQMVLLEDEDE